MITYSGIIQEKPDSENDAIFIGNHEEPFPEILASSIAGKQVNVRYFIANYPETKSVLIEGLIQKLYGYAEAEYEHEYSEYTGYLWTDENIKIGGHDLLAELKGKIGKFLYMEIEIV